MSYMEVGDRMENAAVPALSRGLELIEYVSHLQPVGFNRLQKETGLNTSSLNRIIKTLIQYDYVVKNDEGKYVLGIKPLTVSYGNSSWQALSTEIREMLERICREYDVTSMFVTYFTSGCYVLDKCVCPNNLAMRSVGDLADDYLNTPWGLLKYFEMSDSEKSEFLKLSGKKHKKAYDVIFELFEQCGYADDGSLLHQRLRRIAAPVYDKYGHLAASVAIGSFSQLIDEKTAAKLGCELLKSSRTLSDKLK